MSLDNDETDRVLEEEQPGPPDLESALVTVTLSDVVEHAPLVVEADSSLAKVIEAMQCADRGTALVVEAGKLVGIFTERDVLMKVAGHPIDLTRSKVSAFMTPRPRHLAGRFRRGFCAQSHGAGRFPSHPAG